MNTLLLILVALRALVCGLTPETTPREVANAPAWEEIPYDFAVDWHARMPLSEPLEKSGAAPDDNG